MKKTILLALAAATISLSSVSAQAAEIKQEYCSKASGTVTVKVTGTGGATNVHIAVRSGYDYVYYNKKYISAVSTVLFSERLGRLNSDFAEVLVWTDDGTLDETIRCE